MKETKALNEITVDTEDCVWEPAAGYPDGPRWKVLRRDERGQPQAVLLNLPPGFAMHGHSHVAVEQHYVLEGGYESLGVHYPAGTYRLIPAHADHGPFTSRSGAVILVMWEPVR
jgi:anti-sigma factor ChrR (cupin superfamily)